MNSLHYDLERRNREPHPAEVLLDRLGQGLTAPDAELISRASTCAARFAEFPGERAEWWPHLRAAGRNPLTWQLWAAVEPILCPEVSGRQEVPAPCPQAAPARAPAPEAVPKASAIAPQVDRAGISALIYRVLEWHRTLPDRALAEAATLAPGLVRQAQELMDRAERAPTVAAARALLIEWARTWAGLAGVPEPAL